MKTLVAYAMSWLGNLYKWGGNSPRGIDCSGFVQEILAAAGEDPQGDQTAQGLYDHFIANGGKLKEMGVGALCFYGKSATQITHVTWMVDDYLTIGANGGGSKTVTEADAVNQAAYVKLRPFDYRKDLVAIIMPDYSAYLKE